MTRTPARACLVAALVLAPGCGGSSAEHDTQTPGTDPDASAQSDASGEVDSPAEADALLGAESSLEAESSTVADAAEETDASAEADASQEADASEEADTSDDGDVFDEPEAGEAGEDAAGLPFGVATTDEVIFGLWPMFKVTGAADTDLTEFRLGPTLLASTLGDGITGVPGSISIPAGHNTIDVFVTRNGVPTLVQSLSVYARVLSSDMTPFPKRSDGGPQRLGEALAPGDFNCDGIEDLAVGAPAGTFTPVESGVPGDGAVYVYYGSAAGLVLSPDPSPNPSSPTAPLLLTRPVVDNGFPARRFGHALAAGNLNGDNSGAHRCDDLAIGAPGAVGAWRRGEAWVFFGSPDGLQQGKPVKNNASCVGSICAPVWILGPPDLFEFGWSLAFGKLHGAMDAYQDLVVGAPAADGTRLGAIELFFGSESGADVPLPMDAVFDAPAGSLPTPWFTRNFGLAVATADLDGDQIDDLVVGAPADANGGQARGSVYYYSSLANGVGSGRFAATATSSKWVSPLNPQQDFHAFGGSLAPAGDVNADGYADLVVSTGGLEEFVETPTLYAYYGGPGAPQTTTCVTWGPNAGGTCTLSDQACLLGTCSVEGIPIDSAASPLTRVALAGAHGGGAGSINGDGFAEIVLGLPGLVNSRARVRFGSTYGLQHHTSSSLKPLDNQSRDRFGSAVALASLNGDGLDDIVVSAPDAHTLASHSGKVYAFLGQDPLPLHLSSHNQLLSFNASYDVRQHSAAIPVGDLNGDGFSDLAMRVAGPDTGDTDGQEYAAVVYYGSSTGLVTSPAPSETPALSSHPLLLPPYYGWGQRLTHEFIGAAGDVNGDGFADMVTVSSESGTGVLYFGSASGLLTAPANLLGPVVLFSSASGAAPLAPENDSVGMIDAGDFNADGFSDIVIGSAEAESVMVIYGSAAGPQTDGSLGPSSTVAAKDPCTGPQCHAQRLVPEEATPLVSRPRFGQSVAAVGDVDGDGFADLLVGAPLDDTAGEDNGAAYLFRGGSTGLQTLNQGVSGLKIVPAVLTPQTGRQAGYRVAAARDVNGDGAADLLVGAPFDDTAGFGIGGANLFYGCTASMSGCPPTRVWGIADSGVAPAATEFNAPSCSAGSCRPLFFTHASKSFSRWGMWMVGPGDLQHSAGASATPYADVLLIAETSFQSCTMYGCPPGALNNAGAAILFTGSPEGLRVDSGHVADLPRCVDRTCTPHFLTPSMSSWPATTFYEFGRLTHQAGAATADFDGDGLQDLAIGSSSYVDASVRSAFTGGFYLLR